MLGKPTEKMKQVFDVVHQAQQAALKQAKPGVELASVDAAARKGDGHAKSEMQAALDMLD